VLSSFAAGAVGLLAGSASADVQHVVARGHTIEAIANRYHVPAKTIIEANRIKDPRRIRPGDVLTIPKAEAPKKHKDDPAGTDKKTKAGHRADAKSGPVTYAAKPKTPGV